jgi:hypothetical protein
MALWVIAPRIVAGFSAQAIALVLTNSQNQSKQGIAAFIYE